ncbi:hypothetical protein GCM10009606_39240 [Nocardioides aquiterrae]|uniref:Uncharacterized protein n=1 Tax=Nocardioides aquiterrae TaxID=203799 RepID=A0ABP4FBE0_9ACTN
MNGGGAARALQPAPGSQNPHDTPMRAGVSCGFRLSAAEARGYAPNRRSRCAYARIARRKSTRRKSGQ